MLNLYVSNFASQLRQVDLSNDVVVFDLCDLVHVRLFRWWLDLVLSQDRHFVDHHKLCFSALPSREEGGKVRTVAVRMTQMVFDRCDELSIPVPKGCSPDEADLETVLRLVREIELRMS